MKLFLTRYLKLAHAFYLCIGITIAPLCAQWWWPSLKLKSFILCVAFTFVYAAFFSILIHFVIRNLFLRLLVTVLSCILGIAVLLPIFELSPFILAIPGVIVLSATMQLFDNIKNVFPRVTEEQIRRWLEVTLTLFAVFISSMMVGFTISWNSLYGDVLKGEIERKVVIAGINANILITMYFWFGAGLIFFSGVKHLWLVENREDETGV